MDWYDPLPTNLRQPCLQEIPNRANLLISFPILTPSLKVEAESQDEDHSPWVAGRNGMGREASDPCSLEVAANDKHAPFNDH